MHKLNAICLSLGLLVSCGTPDDGEPGQPGAPGGAGERGPMGAPGRDAVAAGARLRPVYAVGSDGTRMAWTGWFFDSNRRERCMVQLIEGADWKTGPYACAPHQPTGFVPAAIAGQHVRFSME